MIEEFLHAVEAGFVEGLEDVQGGKQKGAGTAGGIENGDHEGESTSGETGREESGGEVKGVEKKTWRKGKVKVGKR